MIEVQGQLGVRKASNTEMC